MLRNITYTIFIIINVLFAKVQAQCNQVETITVCDMTTIDGNLDSVPDGIINLYDEFNTMTGGSISLASGTWFDPNFSFALDEITGNLYLWDLDNSSESITDYQFQLLNTTSGCLNDIVITLNVVVGPFSGFAAPTTGTNDVNVEICNEGSDPCGLTTGFDLFQTFLSTPTAHANGIWSYEGSSPNFIAIQDNKYLEVHIPYQSGVPLVDEETFELIYTVPGITSCSPSVETRVKVSAIREVFSGSANHYNICETELVAGNFNSAIDLRDDTFLVNEDTEGVWLFADDPTGQITGLGDSQVNLKEVYDDLYQSNQRFGCETYEYSYFVESRSAVCESKTSTVTFTFFEYLRPFQQNSTPPEFCVDGSSLPNNYNLNSLLEFTTENGILYNYTPKPNYTGWSLVSGPSALNLDVDSGIINFSNITNTDAGTYTYRYTVSPGYYCSNGDSSFISETIFSIPDGCGVLEDNNHPCQSQSAEVTFVIHPKNYAGEDTVGLEFCETDPLIAAPLDLFTLLTTNGIDDPIYQGVMGAWTDILTGNVVTNPITLPEVNNQQTFNYVYNTTTLNGCLDVANLSFTVYEAYQSGTSSIIDVCNTSSIFNLFDSLVGSPNTTGTWSGPNGFITTDSNAMFNPASSDDGVYTYTVPDNINSDGTIMCSGNSSTVTVALYQSPNAGDDGLYSVCRSDNQIDLNDYLDASANSGGVFNDIDGTNALTGSVLNVSQLTEGTYNYQYEIQGHLSCNLSTAIISIMVEDVNMPTAINQTFCASDGATVSDLQANNGIGFNWYDTATSINVLLPGTVLINGEDYYVSAFDSNNCESEREPIIVTVLPLNHTDCNSCFKDGISVNGDGENDEFDLCGFPIIFPNFELNIYNRYGVIVYKGNVNTLLFEGVSNTSLTIGDKLPSGIYFYIFDPRDGITDVLQGNFYLSR